LSVIKPTGPRVSTTMVSYAMALVLLKGSSVDAADEASGAAPPRSGQRSGRDERAAIA
jgi:hypothetical protein